MANPVLGKSLCSDWFFLGQDFAVRTVSTEMVKPVYFCFGAKWQIVANRTHLAVNLATSWNRIFPAYSSLRNETKRNETD